MNEKETERKLVMTERIARLAISNLSHDKKCPTGSSGKSEECTCLIGDLLKALSQIGHNEATKP